MLHARAVEEQSISPAAKKGEMRQSLFSDTGSGKGCCPAGLDGQHSMAIFQSHRICGVVAPADNSLARQSEVCSMSDERSAESDGTKPLYRDGVPNPERVGFISLNMVGLGPTESSAAAIQVARVLNRPVEFVDEQGYERLITAGAMDAEGTRLAWVENKSKEITSQYVDVEFRLKVMVDDQIVVDWVVQTYNPYFGCHVGYMAWHDQHLVLIYREKHDTYACTFTLNGAMRRECISDYWLVAEGQISYVSKRPYVVERLSLPTLTRLSDLSGEDAQSAGVLPPMFDEVNKRREEREKRHQAWLEQRGPDWNKRRRPPEVKK